VGKGSIQWKSYLSKRGYFCIKDYDIKLGGVYWFVIEPLIGCENKRFFYVKPLSGCKGKYEITGESYIYRSQEAVAIHLSELRKELRGLAIYYSFIDDEGRIYHEKTLPRNIHTAR